MDFKTVGKTHWQRENVFALLRDKLPEIAPYIPNIRKVEVIERRSAGSEVYLVNRWFGTADVPGLSRSIISEDRLTWIDKATWKEVDYTCDWIFVPNFFKENVTCEGTNYYQRSDVNGTELSLTGSLSLDFSSLPGIPAFARGTIARQVERFVIRLITPNLLNMLIGLERYLEEHPQ